MGIVVILPLVAFAAKPIVTQDPVIVPVNPVTLAQEEQIIYYSKIYNVDSKLVSKVIDCESGGENHVVSDGGRSKGVAQFQLPTFLWMEKEFGKDLNYNSSHDQILLLVWGLSKGYGNNWTAYRTIMNGDKYSFYSKQLQRHFTTYCKP